jgi:hypothetical protein
VVVSPGGKLNIGRTNLFFLIGQFYI